MRNEVEYAERVVLVYAEMMEMEAVQVLMQMNPIILRPLLRHIIFTDLHSLPVHQGQMVIRSIIP